MNYKLKEILNNKTKIISFLVFTMLFQSCSSVFYSDRQREKNNTFVINSNYTDYNVSFTKDRYERVVSQNNNVQIEKLKRKYTFFTFTHPDCYDLKIKVKRVPRISAVLIDLPLSIFYLTPYAIDVFRPDFYKIAKKDKFLKLNFQRTDEYFDNKISLAVTNLNIEILDTILTENPSAEYIVKITNKRISIFKSNLYRDINRIKTYNNQNTFESYNYLKTKFKNPPKEGKEILDSVKLSIEKKELLNIKKQSNIFRLIELQKISDSTFFNALENIKKDVEKIALDSIKSNFNFRDLDKLIKIEDSSNIPMLKSFKQALENKSIAEIAKNSNLNLLQSIYDYVGEPTKFSLDSLKPIVVKNNKVQFLKNKIEDIRFELRFLDYDEAIKIINDIYPNQYSESLPENTIIKKILEETLVDKDILDINFKLNASSTLTDYEISEISQLFQNIVSKPITSTQKSQIKELTKTFTAKRIKSISTIVKQGGFNSNEINALLGLSSNEITPSQKKEVKYLKSISDKNWGNEQKRIQAQNKRENQTNTSDYEEKTLALTLCMNDRPSFDEIDYYKLKLYKDLSASMEKNGSNIRIGTWTTSQGEVVIKINGAVLRLEPIYSNNYMDKQKREWISCW